MNNTEFISSSKAHYNMLSEWSYSTYCFPLSQIIVLLLRALHLELLNNCLLPCPGNFPETSFKMTNTLSVEILLNLYKYIILKSTCSSLDPQCLLWLTYLLLSSLTRCCLPKREKVECPTNIILILACMLPGATLFWSADVITKECAILAHCFIAVIVHYARLKNIGQSDFVSHNMTLYQPSLALAIDPGTSTEAEVVAEVVVVVVVVEIIKDLSRDRV